MLVFVFCVRAVRKCRNVVCIVQSIYDLKSLFIKFVEAFNLLGMSDMTRCCVVV
jgi:hypothetical protein